ncbi:MAG: hypothetical protein M0Z55_03850, partial [Peptococcaceae bacterium]|nr:hypothetical protein [Peptococcaceae bacterium]
MSIIQSKYDSGKVSLLKQLLLNSEKSGKPLDYEIKAGDMKVVPRTADPSLFDLHEEYITGDTETVTITLYEGTGNRSDKYIFSLKDKKEQAQPVSSSSLSGIDIERKVDEKVEAYKKQAEYDKVVEENKQLKKQLEDAEEFIENLEKALEKEKGERLKIKGIHLGEIASIAAESLLKRNPHWLMNLPGGIGTGLAGIIMQDNKAQEQPSAMEPGEASFSPHEELSDRERARIEALHEIQKELNEKEQEQAFSLIRLFLERRELITPVISFAMKLKESQPKAAKEKTGDKETGKANSAP